MELSYLTFLLVLALAFANGTNDVSKAIATLAGSGVTNYRAAITWGTAWTMAGAGAAALVAEVMLTASATAFCKWARSFRQSHGDH